MSERADAPAAHDALDARYRDLLSRQLVHNEETWAALVAHGVAPDAPLVLDFAFDAPHRDAAEALRQVLEEETDYDVETAPGDAGRWTVVGATQPAVVSPEVLDAWVEWMVTAGLQSECDFAGWSTTPGPGA